MQDLRLIGVHEDGLHLLLADDEGNRFRVPLDESMRVAARRDRPRLGQLQIEIEGGLRPKDVQSMIRAGMTAEEVAERAGWTVEKVHRYEGPILAEREHVAGLARQVRLRGRGSNPSVSLTLDGRVAERLRSREIDGGTARWDSRRTDKGLWTVLLVFNAGGRQREAAWDFDPLARTVVARDDEARWLSEDEDTESPGPIPAPHLVPAQRPSRVYDVEAEGGVNAAPRPRRGAETVDLMEAMRERSAQRGQRRRRSRATEVPGIEQAPEDALPIEDLARRPGPDELPPAAHPHPADDPAAKPAKPAKRNRPNIRQGVKAGEDSVPRAEVRDDVRSHVIPKVAPTIPDDDETDAVDAGDKAEAHGDGSADAGTEPADLPSGARAASFGFDDGDELEDPPADDVTEAVAGHRSGLAPKPSAPRKSGRPSVPSWDDIMFGRKGE